MMDGRCAEGATESRDQRVEHPGVPGVRVMIPEGGHDQGLGGSRRAGCPFTFCDVLVSELRLATPAGVRQDSPVASVEHSSQEAATFGFRL